MSVENNGQWSPAVNEETISLLQSKGFADSTGNILPIGQRILVETMRIMQACGNPQSPVSHETGIVIGYVQSGKTLSFTTLTALARDNNFQIVIVIAGISVNLLNQSTNRLTHDLRLESRYDRKWTLMQNPSKVEDREAIETTLAQWADSTFPRNRCKTMLITVMKNGSHLRNLTNVLDGLQLEGVPTLIIDDEGDQASLNTKARQAARDGIDFEDLTENELSTIYRRISDLRRIFSVHTFLQYTATPQANLFINIMDRLSPNFIKLLTPGDQYTGGKQYFQENPNLIIEIPLRDIPTPTRPLYEAPDSLINALRIFYLGVVAGEMLGDQRNRTMLVHPSRLQGDHTTYFNWVNSIRDSWKRLLIGNDEDEKVQLIADFQLAYNELALTVAENIPPFSNLIGHNLVHAIQYTPIIEVNARRGATPQINWQDSYSWILVGGQSMDRGFTVEGLTVTYMPRNLGVGNVDTVLQRARFFGYKRSYLGYCRVYLPQVTIDAFNAIIEHEEDVRNRLVDFDLENKHLNDWDRETVLDQMLTLTRSNVLYNDLDRDRFGNDWFRINAPHDTEEFIEGNRKSLFDFLNPIEASFSMDSGHSSRTNAQRHLVARVGIRHCLEHLLNKLRFTRDSDSATYSSLRGILKSYLEEHPNEECIIYLMSAESLTIWSTRERRLDSSGELQQLFQGRNPRVGDIIYPGDSEIKNPILLTIQIHLLDIKDTPYNRVPTLAIWVPDHMGQNIIRQTNNPAA